MRYLGSGNIEESQHQPSAAYLQTGLRRETETEAQSKAEARVGEGLISLSLKSQLILESWVHAFLTSYNSPELINTSLLAWANTTEFVTSTKGLA